MSDPRLQLPMVATDLGHASVLDALELVDPAHLEC